jgi:hypothetical protein
MPSAFLGGQHIASGIFRLPLYSKEVRFFFTRRQPSTARILLVESGSRYLFENVIAGIRQAYGEDVPVDLVTCYPGLPEGFPPETTRVYRVTDFRGRSGRKLLYRELRRNAYSILGIICSDEPIMTKWKWALAARLPAKIFVLNENGDYFWLDVAHLATIRHFVLFRAGLAGAEAVRTLARLFLFPFTLAYLLLYASIVHSRRALRKGLR